MSHRIDHAIDGPAGRRGACSSPVPAVALDSAERRGQRRPPRAPRPASAASTEPSAAAGGDRGRLPAEGRRQQVLRCRQDRHRQGRHRARRAPVTQVGPQRGRGRRCRSRSSPTSPPRASTRSSSRPPARMRSCPALEEAQAAGIKVVGFDAAPAVGVVRRLRQPGRLQRRRRQPRRLGLRARPGVHRRDRDPVGRRDRRRTRTSGSPCMEETLATDPKFAGLELVETVYGDDDATISTTQAQALLQKYPNLKVIVAPTTVGILAAAQVVSQAGKSDSVKVTGLGFPNDMKPFVADGTSPVFGLWSVPDLGYLSYYVADKLVKGEITGAEGETFTVPRPQRRPAVHDRSRTASSSSGRPSGSTRPTSTTSTSSSQPPATSSHGPGATSRGLHHVRGDDDGTDRVSRCASGRARRPSTAAGMPPSGRRCSPSCRRPGRSNYSHLPRRRRPVRLPRGRGLRARSAATWRRSEVNARWQADMGALIDPLTDPATGFHRRWTRSSTSTEAIAGLGRWRPRCGSRRTRRRIGHPWRRRPVGSRWMQWPAPGHRRRTRPRLPTRGRMRLGRRDTGIAITMAPERRGSPSTRGPAAYARAGTEGRSRQT